MKTTEVWKPISGYEGLYEVSDQGRVRSVDRMNSSGRCRLKGKILRPTASGRGYKKVCLYKDGNSIQRYVHALVLEAFSGSRPANCEARHLNGVRDDNRFDNLCWGTIFENAQDRLRHGTQIACETHPLAKITHVTVDRIFDLRSQGKTHQQIADQLGVITRRHVSKILSKDRWRKHPVGATR